MHYIASPGVCSASLDALHWGAREGSIRPRHLPWLRSHQGEREENLETLPMLIADHNTAKYASKETLARAYQASALGERCIRSAIAGMALMRRRPWHTTQADGVQDAVLGRPHAEILGSWGMVASSTVYFLLYKRIAEEKRHIERITEWPSWLLQALLKPDKRLRKGSPMGAHCACVAAGSTCTLGCRGFWLPVPWLPRADCQRWRANLSRTSARARSRDCYQPAPSER